MKRSLNERYIKLHILNYQPLPSIRENLCLSAPLPCGRPHRDHIEVPGPRVHHGDPEVHRGQPRRHVCGHGQACRVRPQNAFQEGLTWSRPVKMVLVKSGSGDHSLLSPLISSRVPFRALIRRVNRIIAAIEMLNAF